MNPFCKRQERNRRGPGVGPICEPPAARKVWAALSALLLAIGIYAPHFGSVIVAHASNLATEAAESEREASPGHRRPKKDNPDLESGKRTRATFFLLPDTSRKAISEKRLAQISHTLAKSLKSNKHLDFHDADQLLAKFSGELPKEKLRRTDTICNRGHDAFHRKRYKDAIKTLRKCIHHSEALLPFIRKRDLAQAILILGAAESKNRKYARARQTFISLLAWRPRTKIAPSLFGKRTAAIFRRARKAAARLKRGSIEILSKPSGAKAYVDGRFLGITPVIAWRLRSGRHYLTLKKTGRSKTGAVVSVNSRAQTTHRAHLPLSEKFLLIQQHLDLIKTQVDQDEASQEMVDLGRILFVDQIVFATLARQKAMDKSPTDLDTLVVKGYLYDLRSRRRLNRVAVNIDKSSNSVAARRLAELLYTDIPYDGSVPLPPEPAPPPKVVEESLFKKWWFWTAIAAGAAATSAAVALPLAFESKGCLASDGCFRDLN